MSRSCSKAVEAVNERQKNVLVRKISHHFKDQLQGRTFALWGLAFKPNTDDMREAPSGDLSRRCCKAGAKVRAYDPVAHGRGAAHLRRARRISCLCKNAYEAAQGADALAIVHRVAGVPQP